MPNLTRREFLKIAGAAAGAAAAATMIPSIPFAAGGPAPASAVNAATAVLRPSFAAPAIIKSGDAIPFIKSAADVAIDSLALAPAGSSAAIIDLKLDGAFLRPAAELKPGLYDLYVQLSRGDKKRTERQPLAVKVVDAFKTDFSFGVISDVHFGDSRLSAKIPNFSAENAFKKEIDILNSRGIEFCLCCGDLCFIPPKSKNDLMDYMNTLAARARFPIFSVPGNHDGYCSGAGGKITADTFKYWENGFGPLRHDAAYGDVALIGVNTYDKDASLRNLYGGLGDAVDMGAMTPSQLEWLEAALRAARDKSRPIIMYGHHNPTNTVSDVNGPFKLEPFSEAGRKELLALIEKFEPGNMFVGHVHGVHEEMYAKTKVTTVPTAGSLPSEGQPIGFYVCSFSSGKVAKIETIEIARV